MRLTVGQDDTQNYKKAPEKQLFFRGQFYFATEGQPNLALGGQLRLPSGVKRARLFQQHLFDWKKVRKEVKIIQPQFLVTKNGKLKSVIVYAKSCRGAMTRFIIKNKLDSPEDLTKFEYEGFEFRSDYGDSNHPHFIID